MAMSTIRKMTDEDVERITAAAQRFIARHGIPYSSFLGNPPRLDEYEGAIDNWISNLRWPDEVGYYRRLWLQAFRRAVREPNADTYGWGYIGYEAK